MTQESPPKGASATRQGQIPSYPEDPTEVDELLEVARDYQKAARTIADDPSLTFRARCVSLIDLHRRARQEILPGFAQAAIWGGCRHLFQPDAVPRDIIEANRRLLRRGHPDCPTCRRPLPSADDLDRWVELGHKSYRRSA